MREGFAAQHPHSASVPQQGQPHLLARPARALAGRAGRGARGDAAARDRRPDAARVRRRGAGRAHRRQGARSRRLAGAELRARRRDPRRRPRCSPRASRVISQRPRGRPFRARAQKPPDLLARRQGGLAGRATARPGHPHARLAAAGRRSAATSRRLVHLPDGRRTWSRSASWSGLDYHDASLSRARPAAGIQDPPAGPAAARGRTSASAWGAKTIPEGGCSRSPTGERVPGGAAHLRRRGRVRQRAQAQGRALRDALGDAGGRDDLRGAQGRTPTWPHPARSRLYDRRCARARSGRDLHNVRNMRQALHRGLYLGGAYGQRDGSHPRGASPGGSFGVKRDAEAGADDRAARLPGARRHAHVRQALERVSLGQPHARRPAQPHPHRPSGSA